MSAQVLVSRPPAPQTIPPGSLPVVRSAEAPHNTGQYSSSGLATSGFRTAKYLKEEWQQGNYNSYYQAFSDRDSSEKVRHEAKQMAAEAEARAQRSQADSTKKFGERLLDIHFWKSELAREIRDLAGETQLLVQQKGRLERALDASEIPYSIATDNLQCRERRMGAELVRDEVEVELLKEVDLIRNVQELLKRTLDQTVQQIRLNRDAKEALEMDWSDKYEAYEMDDKCGKYNNQSTEVQFYHNSSKYEDNTSTPESWAQYSHDNIYKAERERMASINLRSLIDNILQDTSEDLRAQCAAVDFEKRCQEVEDSKQKLQNHLKKMSELLQNLLQSDDLILPLTALQLVRQKGEEPEILEEIGDQENNIAALKQAIKDKEAPLKVSQTRLHQRSYRPNVELCRDPVQFRLISEVGELTESTDILKQKLEESEQSLRNLEDTRMSLEKDIANKANSLFIDREKCMTVRTRYPTVLKLSGYQ